MQVSEVQFPVKEDITFFVFDKSFPQITLLRSSAKNLYWKCIDSSVKYGLRMHEKKITRAMDKNNDLNLLDVNFLKEASKKGVIMCHGLILIIRWQRPLGQLAMYLKVKWFVQPGL